MLISLKMYLIQFFLNLASWGRNLKTRTKLEALMVPFFFKYNQQILNKKKKIVNATEQSEF